MKPSRQCNPPELATAIAVRQAVICEHQCGWGARLSGMVNICELLINVVTENKPKMLTGLN